MKILIIGDFNSIYMKDYAEKVLLEKQFAQNKEYIFFHDSYLPIKEEYMKSYEKDNVSILQCKYRNRLMRFNKVFFIFKKHCFNKLLKKIGYLECIHIHFVRCEHYELIKNHRDNIGKIILTFWGSDVMRLPENKFITMKKMIEMSDIIATGPAQFANDISNRLKINFSDKFELALLGTNMLDKIREYKKHYNKTYDVIRLTCGYNGKHQQNHRMILNAINRCCSEVKNKIRVIIPMGYGADADYIASLEDDLNKMNIQFYIDKKFYGANDIAKFRVESDIFIHAQETDAFSNSVIEYIYADNLLINGKWIKYPLLANNKIHYLEFGSEEELTSIIEYAVANIEEEIKAVKNSNDVLYEMCSWNSLIDDWHNLYI